MWRAMVAVILLPALTAAQAAQSQPAGAESAAGAQSQAKCVPLRPVVPRVIPFTMYDGIRRGRDEQVAIQLALSGFVTTPRSPVSGIVPLQLDLESADGLTLGKLEYPKARQAKLPFRGEQIPIAGPAIIHFKVRADQNAALGAHVLKGKLTFQPVHADSRVGAVTSVDVEIRINVVEHDAKVHPAAWPSPRMPAGLIVLMIVLAPVVIAILPFYMFCMAAGKCD